MLIQCCENPGLYRVHGDTLSEANILEVAEAIMNTRYAVGVALNSPAASEHFLKHKLGKKEREVFGVLFLDTMHRVIAFEEIFQGSLNSVTVHPREVVKLALQLNAAACILAHNHPSGDPEPSMADVNLTYKLIDACKLVDVRVLDHIIVGRTMHSMAAHGDCNF